ncbi:MAG: phosphoglycerate dehydrogenase [Isosphaeraceae bacterium]|nr:phosphoglycerate dehydrogenase [Isosphaeraceae bacterium]
MPNVLICPAPIRNRPGAYRDLLVAAGFTPIDVEGGATLTREQISAALPAADAMIAGGEPLTADMMDLAPNLRVIARTGVGYDAIDLAAATARKIAVTITPGTNQGSVAEQTFALILALTRRITINDRAIRAGVWDRTMPLPLRGQTLGLVGLGRIGRAVASRARAFEMRVVAYDPISDPAFDAQYGLLRVELPELLAQADIVSLHLPLTPATRGLFNRETFARMKPGAILINTGRGGLVVEHDLYESLVSGHLAGAGLDVTDPEPPRPDNPLISLPNVVISPHIGGIDTRSMADMAELAARCIVDLYQGRWPADCVVNGELAEGWHW